MKSASWKIVLILVGTFFVISWLRTDHGGFGNVVKTLPFCGGHRPSFYDIGAIALIVFLFWGFRRLKGFGQQTSGTDYDEDDWDDDQWDEDEDDEDD